MFKPKPQLGLRKPYFENRFLLIIGLKIILKLKFWYRSKQTAINKAMYIELNGT